MLQYSLLRTHTFTKNAFLAHQYNKAMVMQIIILTLQLPHIQQRISNNWINATYISFLYFKIINFWTALKFLIVLPYKQQDFKEKLTPW